MRRGLLRSNTPNLEDGIQPVTVFNDSRAQHVAIVMRRIFGLDLRPETTQHMADCLEDLLLPKDMEAQLKAHDGELLELLSTAVPNSEESHALVGASAAHGTAALRLVEQWSIPFANIPHVKALLRALRLGTQAESVQTALLSRVVCWSQAGDALCKSIALQKLFQAIVALGSWINSVEPGWERGFEPSSALGKLRQFRAIRGDRDIALLHVVILVATDGDTLQAGLLGRNLGKDLVGLPDAAKEDLKQLHSSIVAFRADAEWFKEEAEQETQYSQKVRDRFLEIYRDELCWRAEALEEAWESARTKWKTVVKYFAERSDPCCSSSPSAGTGGGSGGLEGTSERLMTSVERFRKEAQEAAKEVATQSERFTQALRLPKATLEETTASDAGRRSSLPVGVSRTTSTPSLTGDSPRRSMPRARASIAVTQACLHERGRDSKDQEQQPQQKPLQMQRQRPRSCVSTPRQRKGPPLAPRAKSLSAGDAEIEGKSRRV
mmetsp:Transcript_72883/g.159253  ORF Transcript_72883/g.159253 Transcript_72883/m.159253 type:complete len:493 (-) Transcript_72883:185-1663(-)